MNPQLIKQNGINKHFATCPHCKYENWNPINFEKWLCMNCGKKFKEGDKLEEENNFLLNLLLK